jgi:hypothetical protein
MEITNTIQKVKEYKTWTTRQKIDKLLEVDCSQYTNLGSDSLTKDREEVKKNSRKIYTAIKDLDYPTGKLFLEAMDTKKTTFTED